ncbi:MAG: hypothetical protein ACI4PF_01130 [Christensenellales bacterium]
MEKTFDVIMIPKATLILRGVSFKAKLKCNTMMTEKELNSFRDFIDIISCNEIYASCENENITQKSLTIQNNEKGESNGIQQKQSNRKHKKNI